MTNIKDVSAIVNTIYRLAKYRELNNIRIIMENTDLEEIFELAYDGYVNNEVDIDTLTKIIRFLNYLEEETSIPTPVNDSLYDKILEVLNENQITSIGSDDQFIDDGSVREHQYPELRGSLQKVHFTTSEEIPKKDSRKSLEDFLRIALQNGENKMQEAHLPIFVDYKWDGASNVFECDGDSIEHVLTRYKVELNLGKDVSHVYKGNSVQDIFGYKIPRQFYSMGKYGVKVEVIMSKDNFEEYRLYTMDKKCNRRSAVASITNRTDDNLDPNLLNFLEVVPLQISTEVPVEGNPDVITTDDRIWFHAGIINNRHQYIAFYWNKDPMMISMEKIVQGSIDSVAKSIYAYRELIEEDAKKKGYPIDGMVITIGDMGFIGELGREHHKNKFQVAYKFPAGIKKTKLKDVVFQVGPIAGTITPVAEVEPIVMNGNTITHIGLSNMEKLERLDLHIGDEVLVQYDIIPKIIVDSTCKKSCGRKIETITKCPVCNNDIQSGRCVNPDCDAKTVGRIAAFTKKMNIPGFGIETVSFLVEKGILSSIPGLYRLNQRAGDMIRLPGYQEKSVSSLINAPLSRTNIYPHELFGSIGIPDVSLSTMEKVFRTVSVDKIMNDPEILLSMYQKINGLGEITTKKIIQGIDKNKRLLQELIPWFTFKEYGDESENQQLIMFTNIRDPKFSEYLREKFNLVSPKNDGFTTKAIALIVPDGVEVKSTKKDKAIEKGIPILTISEAKQKWGYV